jgi:hypothetical protein
MVAVIALAPLKVTRLSVARFRVARDADSAEASPVTIGTATAKHCLCENRRRNGDDRGNDASNSRDDEKHWPQQGAHPKGQTGRSSHSQVLHCGVAYGLTRMSSGAAGESERGLGGMCFHNCKRRIGAASGCLQRLDDM